MTFLFMMMEKLPQDDYVYDELYEAVLIYDKKMFITKIFTKTS
jgi:hypothetical protein